MSHEQRKPRPSSPIFPSSLYPLEYEHKVSEIREDMWGGEVNLLDDLMFAIEDALVEVRNQHIPDKQ